MRSVSLGCPEKYILIVSQYEIAQTLACKCLLRRVPTGHSTAPAKRLRTRLLKYAIQIYAQLMMKTSKSASWLRFKLQRECSLKAGSHNCVGCLRMHPKRPQRPSHRDKCLPHTTWQAMQRVASRSIP